MQFYCGNNSAVEVKGIITICTQIISTVIREAIKLPRTISTKVSLTKESFSKEIMMDRLHKSKRHARGFKRK